jgi:SOS-response transcriptional repressor LexA
MPAPTLRDRILEIKSSPSTAETGVKALVKKMKEEFGDEVNAKIVRQHLEELEKTGTLRPSPTNNPVVSGVSER